MFYSGLSGHVVWILHESIINIDGHEEVFRSQLKSDGIFRLDFIWGYQSI